MFSTKYEWWSVEMINIVVVHRIICVCRTNDERWIVDYLTSRPREDLLSIHPKGIQTWPQKPTARNTAEPSKQMSKKRGTQQTMTRNVHGRNTNNDVFINKTLNYLSTQLSTIRIPTMSHNSQCRIEYSSASLISDLDLWSLPALG